MIYVVEDDKSIRELVAYALGSAGYETEGFTSGAEFFAALDAARARLVLLDIMLPVMDGWSVCAHIREKAKTPIIMLTAKSEVFDRIQGLEMGADDAKGFVQVCRGVEVFFVQKVVHPPFQHVGALAFQSSAFPVQFFEGRGNKGDADFGSAFAEYHMSDLNHNFLLSENLPAPGRMVQYFAACIGD